MTSKDKMKTLTKKEKEEWDKIYVFVKWNYQGDFKNKVLNKVDKVVRGY